MKIMSIKQKLLAGFGLMIMLTGLAAGVGWWQARQAALNTTVLLKTDLPQLRGVMEALADLKKRIF